jgi:hypothetical protein
MAYLAGAALQGIGHYWGMQPEVAAGQYAAAAIAHIIPNYAPTFDQAKKWVEINSQDPEIKTTDDTAEYISSIISPNPASIITVQREPVSSAISQEKLASAEEPASKKKSKRSKSSAAVSAKKETSAAVRKPSTTSTSAEKPSTSTAAGPAVSTENSSQGWREYLFGARSEEQSASFVEEITSTAVVETVTVTKDASLTPTKRSSAGCFHSFRAKTTEESTSESSAEITSMVDEETSTTPEVAPAASTKSSHASTKSSPGGWFDRFRPRSTEESTSSVDKLRSTAAVQTSTTPEVAPKEESTSEPIAEATSAVDIKTSTSTEVVTVVSTKSISQPCYKLFGAEIKQESTSEASAEITPAVDMETATTQEAAPSTFETGLSWDLVFNGQESNAELYAEEAKRTASLDVETSTTSQPHLPQDTSNMDPAALKRAESAAKRQAIRDAIELKRSRKPSNPDEKSYLQVAIDWIAAKAEERATRESYERQSDLVGDELDSDAVPAPHQFGPLYVIFAMFTFIPFMLPILLGALGNHPRAQCIFGYAIGTAYALAVAWSSYFDTPFVTPWNWLSENLFERRFEYLAWTAGTFISSFQNSFFDLFGRFGIHRTDGIFLERAFWAYLAGCALNAYTVVDAVMSRPCTCAAVPAQAPGPVHWRQQPIVVYEAPENRPLTPYAHRRHSHPRFANMHPVTAAIVSALRILGFVLVIYMSSYGQDLAIALGTQMLITSACWLYMWQDWVVDLYYVAKWLATITAFYAWVKLQMHEIYTLPWSDIERWLKIFIGIPLAKPVVYWIAKPLLLRLYACFARVWAEKDLPWHHCVVLALSISPVICVFLYVSGLILYAAIDYFILGPLRFTWGAVRWISVRSFGQLRYVWGVITANNPLLRIFQKSLRSVGTLLLSPFESELVVLAWVENIIGYGPTAFLKLVLLWAWVYYMNLPFRRLLSWIFKTSTTAAEAIRESEVATAARNRTPEWMAHMWDESIYAVLAFAANTVAFIFLAIWTGFDHMYSNVAKPVFASACSGLLSVYMSFISPVVLYCTDHWCQRLHRRWLLRLPTIVALTAFIVFNIINAYRAYPQRKLRALFAMVFGFRVPYWLSTLSTVGGIECTQDVIIIICTLLLFLLDRRHGPHLQAPGPNDDGPDFPDTSFIGIPTPKPTPGGPAAETGDAPDTLPQPEIKPSETSVIEETPSVVEGGDAPSPPDSPIDAEYQRVLDRYMTDPTNHGLEHPEDFEPAQPSGPSNGQPPQQPPSGKQPIQKPVEQPTQKPAEILIEQSTQQHPSNQEPSEELPTEQPTEQPTQEQPAEAQATPDSDLLSGIDVPLFMTSPVTAIKQWWARHQAAAAAAVAVAAQKAEADEQAANEAELNNATRIDAPPAIRTAREQSELEKYWAAEKAKEAAAAKKEQYRREGKLDTMRLKPGDVPSHRDAENAEKERTEKENLAKGIESKIPPRVTGQPIEAQKPATPTNQVETLQTAEGPKTPTSTGSKQPPVPAKDRTNIFGTVSKPPVGTGSINPFAKYIQRPEDYPESSASLGSQDSKTGENVGEPDVPSKTPDVIITDATPPKPAPISPLRGNTGGLTIPGQTPTTTSRTTPEVNIPPETGPTVEEKYINPFTKPRADLPSGGETDSPPKPALLDEPPQDYKREDSETSPEEEHKDDALELDVPPGVESEDVDFGSSPTNPDFSNLIGPAGISPTFQVKRADGNQPSGSSDSSQSSESPPVGSSSKPSSLVPRPDDVVPEKPTQSLAPVEKPTTPVAPEKPVQTPVQTTTPSLLKFTSQPATSAAKPPSSPFKFGTQPAAQVPKPAPTPITTQPFTPSWTPSPSRGFTPISFFGTGADPSAINQLGNPFANALAHLEDQTPAPETSENDDRQAQAALLEAGTMAAKAEAEAKQEQEAEEAKLKAKQDAEAKQEREAEEAKRNQDAEAKQKQEAEEAKQKREAEFKAKRKAD